MDYKLSSVYHFLINPTLNNKQQNKQASMKVMRDRY